MRERGERDGEAVPVAYVTKYALTQGILVFRDLELSQDSPGASIYLYGDHVKMGKYNWFGSLFMPQAHWEPSLELAMDKAKKMLAAKLTALDKQRAKLEKYVPKVVEFNP